MLVRVLASGSKMSVCLLRPRSSAAARAAMAAPLSEENKLAQDLLLQMKDYTPTVRCLAASPSHPQPCGSTT